MTRPGRGRKAAAGARPRRRSRTAAAAVVGAGVAVGLLVGCGADAEAAAADGLALRLVIPDANIREPGTPCSGAHGFRFAHAQAPYSIQDAAGREVGSGLLPEGSAEQAYTLDLGEARQPTVCVMLLDLAGLDALDDHWLVIGDRSPVPIRPNPSLDGLPEAVLR